MPKPARKEPLDIPAMIAELRAWLPEIEPLARVEQRESDGAWRFEVVPARDGACGFSLVLATDGKYDLFIGVLFSQENWDWPADIRALDLCKPHGQHRRLRWFERKVELRQRPVRYTVPRTSRMPEEKGQTPNSRQQDLMDGPAA